MKEGLSLFRESIRLSYAHQKVDSVCGWVERFVNLPTGASKGRVSLRNAPYAREPLEHFNNKDTRRLVLVFPTQSSKTTILIMGMLFRIANDPVDGLWVMPSSKSTKDFSKERFQNFVLQCPPVLQLVPKTGPGNVDLKRWGVTSQNYSSCMLNFVGAGSPTELSSRAVGIICADEIDKFINDTKWEANALALAEERLKTFPLSLMVLSSTPTTIEQSLILQEYERTDQRKFFVPCPRCEREILLCFNVKSDEHGPCGLRWWREEEEESKTNGEWDKKKVMENSYYKCQLCGKEIADWERPMMLENGIWRPTNNFASEGEVGYRINALYSILSPATSLPRIAIQFLTSIGNRSAMQNFTNAYLAEGFSEEMAYVSREVEAEVYNTQDIDDKSLPVMGVDCQMGQSDYWVVIRRFTAPCPEFPDGVSWQVYADHVQSEEELVELQTEYSVENQNVILDMANNPNKVGKMCLRHGWFGIWGTDTPYFPWRAGNGRVLQRCYSVINWRDPALGTSWANKTSRVPYTKFSKSGAMDVIASLRWHKPPIWHVSATAHPMYSAHINSRVKRERRNPRTGKMENEWIELSRNDHLLDAEIFCMVRALQCGFMIVPDETSKSTVALA